MGSVRRRGERRTLLPRAGHDYEYELPRGRIPRARWARWGASTFVGGDYYDLDTGALRPLPEVAAATGSSKALDGSNRLLRKAETVIRRRTSQLLIVIERTNTSHNYSAVLRTAEALGVQHVWYATLAVLVRSPADW